MFGDDAWNFKSFTSFHISYLKVTDSEHAPKHLLILSFSLPQTRLIQKDRIGFALKKCASLSCTRIKRLGLNFYSLPEPETQLLLLSPITFWGSFLTSAGTRARTGSGVASFCPKHTHVSQQNQQENKGVQPDPVPASAVPGGCESPHHTADW